jgi:hypothetical protein
MDECVRDFMEKVIFTLFIRNSISGVVYQCFFFCSVDDHVETLKSSMKYCVEFSASVFILDKPWICFSERTDFHES